MTDDRYGWNDHPPLPASRTEIALWIIAAVSALIGVVMLLWLRG